MEPLSPTAQRFPLIPRPRPGFLPLRRRVANLTELAASAQCGDASPGTASSVFNLLCTSAGPARPRCYVVGS
jgi:hypothetical protein